MCNFFVIEGIFAWGNINNNLPNAGIGVVVFMLQYAAQRMIGYFSAGGVMINTRPLFFSGRRCIEIASHHGRNIDVKVAFDVVSTGSRVYTPGLSKTIGIGLLDSPKVSLIGKRKVFSQLIIIPSRLLRYVDDEKYALEVRVSYVHEFTNHRAEVCAEIFQESAYLD